MDMDIRYAFGELGEVLAYPDKQRDWEGALQETNPEIYALFEEGMRSAAYEAGHGDDQSLGYRQEVIAIKDISTFIYAPIFFRLGQKEFPKLSAKVYENFIKRYDESGSFIALVRALDIAKRGWGDHFNNIWDNYEPAGTTKESKWYGLTPTGKKIVLTMGHGLLVQTAKFISDDMLEYENVADERYSLGPAHDPELEEEYATEGSLARIAGRVPKLRRVSLGEGMGRVLQFRPRSK